MKVKTDEKFILNLQWTEKELEEGKKMLSEWDGRDLTYYKHLPKYIRDSDLAEREHLRNAIKYYEEKFNNEESL